VTGRDPLTGAPVVVVSGRQDRPNLPPSGCPFCPGGVEAPEPYETRWFPNRFPPLPDGRAEVVLYSPRHDAAFWELGVAGARKVVDLWAERTAALGARDDVSYVLCFENRGPEVGATISHPHGQIYALSGDVPPAPLAELAGGPCALCAVRPPPDLVVAVAGGWAAWVPAEAAWPYELRLAPGAHLPDLPSADGTARDGLAAVLVDALGRLDRLFGGPMPYMLWVHQRPTDGGAWPSAHLHLHVAPLLRSPGVPRFVAAGELGSGVWFNPVDPRSAAEALRSA
jgi:UDPglucose--hexose-1-phosphate uridylyltransferase